MPPTTPKHADQIKREKVPTIAALSTQYRPLSNHLMVVPLEDIKTIGGIILPNTSVIQVNEGHVVARGPDCSEQVKEGACVCWPDSTDYRMSCDDGTKFVIINEASVLMAIPADVLSTKKETPAPSRVDAGRE